jgi:hypothetical protein
MTLNIKDGDYVKLRDGSMLGPVRIKTEPSLFSITFSASAWSWTAHGCYRDAMTPDPRDIIEVLPVRPVFIDTPFEVGKTYRQRDGDKRKIAGFALQICSGMTRHLDGRCRSDCGASLSDLLPGAIEDEEQVTVTMPKADYERTMELLGRAKG